MNTILKPVFEQGKADGLAGRQLPKGALLATDEFWTTYVQGWFEGAIEDVCSEAKTDSRIALSVGQIVARG